MAELTQDGVWEIAAEIIDERAHDCDFMGVGERMADLLERSDFTDEEWDKAHRAIHDAIGDAVVVASWPEPEQSDAEPFADRDGWHAVLMDRQGFVEPDPDRYFAAMAGFTDYADESVLYDVEPDEMRVRVARGSALPTMGDDGEWRSTGTYNGKDVARDFGDNGMDEFEEMDDAKAAWLDAVAVAASRNQRAEAGR